MTDFDVDGCDYGWKNRQRQLDPDSRRSFEGIGVAVVVAGALFVALVLMLA